MKKVFEKFSFAIWMVCIFCTLTLSAQTKKQVSINGSIRNNKFTSVSLYQIGKDAALLQTLPIGTDSKFSFAIEIDKTDFYKLQFDNNNFIMMVLQPGEKIEVSTDANDFIRQLDVKGSVHTAHIFRNQKMMIANKEKLDSINSMVNKEVASPKFDSLRAIYSTGFDKIKSSQDKALRAFILQNPTSLAILFLSDALPVDANYDVYSSVDSTLLKTYPDNYYVNNFHLQLISSRATAIGATAPDFNLPDTSGTKISLSSFRGKYVVIDFWAAWCGPCRREMPNMVKLYNDFKNKGFEILGVSLDKTRDKWVDAIKVEHMTWPQVSDLKFWQSEVAAMYSVKAIPYTVLLDKDGKIVAKNLRGEELYKKVESLLQ